MMTTHKMTFILHVISRGSKRCYEILVQRGLRALLIMYEGTCTLAK